MENATCVINPDPDIAGVGIRISLYLQALLAVICAELIFITGLKTDGSADGQHLEEILKVPRERLKRLSAVALATGISLIIGAFVTARTSRLTVYHGLIVLNLCWINFFTVVSIFSAGPTTIGQLLLAIVQLSLTGSFGFWLFIRIDSFGSQSECTHTTIYYIAQHYVRADNPSVRRFWLAIYIMAAIPGLNWLILYVFSCLAAFLAAAINPLAAALLPLISVIGLIISTEKTITHNVVGPGESQWGFGQTLALVLVIIPLRETIKVFQFTQE